MFLKCIIRKEGLSLILYLQSVRLCQTGVHVVSRKKAAGLYTIIEFASINLFLF